MAERTTTLAFILKDGASKGMRELNKTARTLGKTAGTLNAPFAAAAQGFAIAAGAAIAVGGAMFAAAKAAGEEKRRFLRSLRVNSVAKRWPAVAAVRLREAA